MLVSFEKNHRCNVCMDVACVCNEAYPQCRDCNDPKRNSTGSCCFKSGTSSEYSLEQCYSSISSLGSSLDSSLSNSSLSDSRLVRGTGSCTNSHKSYLDYVRIVGTSPFCDQPGAEGCSGHGTCEAGRCARARAHTHLSHPHMHVRMYTHVRIYTHTSAA